MGSKKTAETGLTRRLRVLQRKHRQLLAQNTFLRLEDHILTTSCAGLAALRQHVARETHLLLDSHAAAHVQQLRQHEEGLLAQLGAATTMDVQQRPRSQQMPPGSVTAAALAAAAPAAAAQASRVDDDRSKAFFVRLLEAAVAGMPLRSHDAQATQQVPRAREASQAVGAKEEEEEEEGRQLVVFVRAALMDVSVQMHTLTVLDKRPSTSKADRQPILQRIRTTWIR